MDWRNLPDPVERFVTKAKSDELLQ